MSTKIKTKQEIIDEVFSNEMFSVLFSKIKDEKEKNNVSNSITDIVTKLYDQLIPVAVEVKNNPSILNSEEYKNYAVTVDAADKQKRETNG